MGTRIGSSSRFPSTRTEAYALACGAYSTIFESIVRRDVPLHVAAERWEHATGQLRDNLDRITADECGSPTAWENVGSSRL